MRKRKELQEIAKKAEKNNKRVKGLSDSLASDWEEIVTNCEREVESAAKRGEFKYFFDASEHSMKTTDAVAAELKERLDDILIIVSPRGVEINWESSE